MSDPSREGRVLREYRVIVPDTESNRKILGFRWDFPPAKEISIFMCSALGLTGTTVEEAPDAE